MSGTVIASCCRVAIGLGGSKCPICQTDLPQRANPTLTLQQAAQMALDVQTACNLAGILRSWVRCHDTVRQHPWNPGQMRHPINRLFAEQVAHLTGAGVPSDTHNSYSQAYDWCERVAKGGQP